MGKRFLVFVSIILALSLLGCTKEPERPQLAEVTRIQNQVETLIVKQKDWTQAIPEQKMAQGDSIRTGKASLAELKYLDGSVVRLAELSNLLVENQKDANLTAGKLLIHVAKGQGGRRVVTPSVVAASLGTTWLAEIHENGVTLTVLEGTVNVDSQAKSVEVKQGMSLTVEAGRPLSSPRKVNLRRILETEELITKFEPIDALSEIKAQLDKEERDRLAAAERERLKKLAEMPLFSRIIKVDETSGLYYFDRGKDGDVRVKEKFVVYKAGKEIKDEAGNILGVRMTPINVITVTKVDKSSSSGKLSFPKKKVVVGDSVAKFDPKRMKFSLDELEKTGKVNSEEKKSMPAKATPDSQPEPMVSDPRI